MTHLPGIGWRQPHYAELLRTQPALGFLEVHSENFFADGGAALEVLRQARQTYPVSLHGVGLALGSASGLDEWHLDRLARLVSQIEPMQVSDHACFARGLLDNGTAVHASDLLPIPFNTAALEVLCANVQQVQDRLQRPLLIENISAYVEWADNDRSECEFLRMLARRTGCKLLVDVNNLYVNALNARQNRPARDLDPVADCKAWLDAMESQHVGEIHLAGHCVTPDIVIDDHGSRVCDDVWSLYRHAVLRFGAVPTLVEWDTDIPALDVLLEEVHRANAIALEACK